MYEKFTPIPRIQFRMLIRRVNNFEVSNVLFFIERKTEEKWIFQASRNFWATNCVRTVYNNKIKAKKRRSSNSETRNSASLRMYYVCGIDRRFTTAIAKQPLRRQPENIHICNIIKRNEDYICRACVQTHISVKIEMLVASPSGDTWPNPPRQIRTEYQRRK